MSATIIDGKEFAASVREKVAQHVSRLKEDHDITPGLAVVLVGEDPASQVYVRNKGKQTVEVGMKSYEHKLEASISQDYLLRLIEKLNEDPDVHGILCQLPLPDHIDEDMVINAIAGRLTDSPQTVCCVPDNGAIVHLQLDGRALKLVSMGRQMQTHVN